MSDLSEDTQIHCIPLDRIDLTDTRYQINRDDEDISALALAIKQNNLTRLPLVRPMGDFHVVVTGLNWVKALAFNRSTAKIVCQTKPLASEKAYAVLAVSDLAFQRPLTLVELIQSLLLLNRFMDPNLLSQNAQSIFNTRLNAGYIMDLLDIGAMTPQVLDLIHDGRLSIGSAKKFSGCSPDLIEIFLDLFSTIKTSTSKQLEIITHFQEIIAREGLDSLEFYQTKPFQEIRDHKGDDPGFKGNLLRQFLRERRFPFLEKNRQDIQKKIHSLGLESNMKFMVPENFESMTYSLSFDFKTLEEFKARIDFLDGVYRHPALKEILDR